MSDLISTQEVAVILGCHVNTIRAMIARGQLPRPIAIHKNCHRHRRADVLDLAARLRSDTTHQQDNSNTDRS